MLGLILRVYLPFGLGIGLVLAGLICMYVGFDGDSILMAITGFILFQLGLVSGMTGFGLLVTRRPTDAELARQNPDNINSWQLRPAGLALLLGLLVLFGALAAVAQSRWGDRFEGRGFAGLAALPLAALFSFRKVRQFVFYIKE